MKPASLTAKRRTPDKKDVKASDVVLDERFRIAPFVIRLTEDNKGVNVPNRIQLFRTGTFKKLMADGSTVQFSITKADLLEMIVNFENKVRGVHIALDFAHKSDEEAAGWLKKLVLEEQGNEAQLWAELDWTPDGHAAVAGKKFRYVSPDFAFKWKDNETGEEYGATLFGAGLTNRPVIKNMAPTVELTEVKEMAAKKTTVKKISEMTKEELELRLAEEKDEEKKELIQLRLDEMAEGDETDDGDDESSGDENPAPAKNKKDKKMTMEELEEAHQKVCEELADLKKNMAKTLAETEQRQREATFSLLLAEGKVVPAQKDAFLANDTVKFAELTQKPKFQTIGAHGAQVNKEDSAATDEVLRLAEQAVKDGRAQKRADAISLVLHENRELNARYMKEMEGSAKPGAEQ